ncbi:MAG TPA: YeeE/YedE thiosulfate transporter family protein [Tahibacter sp.]|uniref:YeeE/YedE thiosulfate transporter family protein n=1 Tax=Tahibacter sp. TaxID=2056211 RepID=UPI002BD4010C|nr:YeeE/YedE thiosulfate transporter family protein [Tahibacter sp.]HSX62251.1 YeeE/YedE thiosulfate transporter family protein [Tahibacter sp.]
MNPARTPRDYADPYLAGAALGLVLLAAFVLVGRGLGASGAFASTAAGAVALVAPEQAAASPLFAHYLGEPGPWLEWLSIELIGVLIGAAASAALAGRLRVAVERPPSVSRTQRLAFAFGGGALMAAGAVFARGCTSGQALTGGALLGVGGWTFLGAAFASAYALAPLLRKVWA